MSPVRPELMSLDPPLRTKIEQELQGDEQLLWFGQPFPWRLVRLTLPVLLFAIPWTAFALYWTFMASGGKWPRLGDPWSWFPLWGVPFILVGLAMLSSPLWMLRAAGRTVYLLTTRRAIIIGGAFSTTVYSFPLNQLRNVIRRERDDGSGDLIFEREIVSHGEGGIHRRDVGFLGISNVRQVEQMLRDAAAPAS